MGNTKKSVIIFGVLVFVLFTLVFVTLAPHQQTKREDSKPSSPSDSADTGTLPEDNNDTVSAADDITTPKDTPQDDNESNNETTIEKVFYGKESRQWLMIYRPSAKPPTNGYPVYLWAHGNGGAADRPSSRMVKEMTGAGYAVISWESIPTIRTSPEQFQIAQNDADLMWSWFKKNAGSYTINSNNVIIGGESRGSGLSWEIAHSGDPAIKGIYMYNAVPDSFWLFTDQWNPDDFVNPKSPPIEFVYGPTRGDGDSHRPENGDSIRAEYEANGIEDRFIAQTEGLGDSYKFPTLLTFAQAYFD